MGGPLRKQNPPPQFAHACSWATQSVSELSLHLRWRYYSALCWWCSVLCVEDVCLHLFSHFIEKNSSSAFSCTLTHFSTFQWCISTGSRTAHSTSCLPTSSFRWKADLTLAGRWSPIQRRPASELFFFCLVLVPLCNCPLAAWLPVAARKSYAGRLLIKAHRVAVMGVWQRNTAVFVTSEVRSCGGLGRKPRGGLAVVFVSTQWCIFTAVFVRDGGGACKRAPSFLPSLLPSWIDR